MVIKLLRKLLRKRAPTHGHVIVARDAKTGRFVTLEYAKENPDTTVIHVYNRKGSTEGDGRKKR